MTNKQIQSAFFTLLKAADYGYPIAWPGIKFTPPKTGVWLEVDFFPNRGIDNGLDYASTVTPVGVFQVTVATRPGKGVITIGLATQKIATTFARGTTITGSVRVSRAPYNLSLLTEDDKIYIPVTIPYAG